MNCSEDSIDLIELSKQGTWAAMKVFAQFNVFMCQAQEKSAGLKALLNYPDDFNFDLVIYDFTSGPCLLGLLHKFKYPPVIGVTAFNNPPFTMDVMGGFKSGLMSPPFFTLHYEKEMNVFQRTLNGFIHFFDSL